MVRLLSNAKMDKTVLTVASLHDPSDGNEYWRRQTPEARLEALELMRQVIYGYDPSTERLQRLLTITHHRCATE
ncbi:MAG: hypothetical protein ACRYFS_26625 [Janthinobacterium lividum]